jgi:TonB family protein
MMSSTVRFGRTFWMVTLLHVGILVGALIFTSMRSCLRETEEPEARIFVSLHTPAPPTAVPDAAPAPEPPPPEPPAPPPPTPPVPAAVPQPPEPAPPAPRPRPPINVSTTRVAAPRATQPTPRRAPALTEEQIRQRLERQIGSPAPGPVATGATVTDELSRYYALMHETLFRAWQQPTTVRPGTTATAEIRVQRDGRITARRITRSSGDTTMDQSVQRALDTVTRLSPLPSLIPGAHYDFSIEFELTGALR